MIIIRIWVYRANFLHRGTSIRTIELKVSVFTRGITWFPELYSISCIYISSFINPRWDSRSVPCKSFWIPNKHLFSLFSLSFGNRNSSIISSRIFIIDVFFKTCIISARISISIKFGLGGISLEIIHIIPFCVFESFVFLIVINLFIIMENTIF